MCEVVGLEAEGVNPEPRLMTVWVSVGRGAKVAKTGSWNLGSGRSPGPS